jgi:hypothetical protein
MASIGFLDSWYVFQFVKRLVKPFDKWEAYRTGVIDAEGNILIPEEKRTEAQKDSFKYFDLLIRNMKRLLGKIPGGSSRIATYAAAVWLLREWDELEGKDFELLHEDIIKFINEDVAAPVNSVGGGQVAGLNEDPPGKKQVKKKIIRRPKQKIFEDAAVSFSFNNIDTVKKYLRALFGKIGLGFDFSGHFTERMNDKRNQPPINMQEMLNFFVRLYQQKRDTISRFKVGDEFLVTDLKSNLNVPLAFKGGGNSNFLRAITIIRKKGFGNDDFPGDKKIRIT